MKTHRTNHELCWCAAGLLTAASVLVFLAAAHARSREHWGDGFSIDLDHPYAQVLEIVQSVVDDGMIRGTFQYKGTSYLDGASAAKVSNAFKPWTEGGAVLYKVRPRALAPEHFRESGDQGTVTVRYVVQQIGPNATRLRIDAIFLEDSLHHSHPSDGTTENAEFLAISDKIKDLEDHESKKLQDAAVQQEQQRLGELQAELETEKAQLNAVKAKQQQLQNAIAELQKGRAGHVRTASANLKAAPYNASQTLQSLAQGDTVTVLLQSPYWYRVQAPNGQQGWVYRLMVEVAP